MHLHDPDSDADQPNKTCNTCAQVKPLSEFPRNVKRRDGRDGRCRTCTAASNSETKDPKKVRAVANATRRAHRRLADAHPDLFHRYLAEELPKAAQEQGWDLPAEYVRKRTGLAPGPRLRLLTDESPGTVNPKAGEGSVADPAEPAAEPAAGHPEPGLDET